MARPARKFDWEKAIREAQLGNTRTAVALVLATYANGEGASARPGQRRLHEGLGMSRSPVSRALASLRALGFITLVREGNSFAGHADEYQLSLPDCVSSPHTCVSPGRGYGSGEHALCPPTAATSDQGPDQGLPEQEKRSDLEGPWEAAARDLQPFAWQET